MDNSSLGTSFDFNSQSGVMAVLSAIRASNISSADKNELRDLVFLYSNGGGDPSIRLALETKLRNLNIVPIALSTPTPTQKEEPKPEPTSAPHPFGTARPAPVFSAPKPRAEEVKVTKAPAVTVPVASPVKVASVVAPMVKESVPEKIVTTPAPKATPVMPPVPKSEPVKNEAGTIPSTDADISKYLDRIREIKATVNGKVGNPVNLVDINNEVGREYMNALLDAMKRLSGGVGQIEPAMARLELSFASVLAAIDANERSKVVAAPVKEEIIQPEITKVEPVIAKPPVPPIPEASVERVVAVEPAVKESASWSEVPKGINEVRPSDTVLQPVITSQAVAPQPKVELERQSVVAKPPVPSTPVAPSVSEAPRVLTPEDLPSPSSLETSETGDPLFTHEVDEGLEQLLSDWVLFKKSGLFGTGPKGREHPLFKKIASLQITLLLAGRFEGSTQEIKQSITDYMNGWRYEQGIIYEQGETFEHYLRRVIKQILDLQKKRRNT